MCFGVAESLGQAKISNLSPKICGQEDVPALHISVYQCWLTSDVQILKTLCSIKGDLKALLPTEWFTSRSGSQMILQVPFGHVLVNKGQMISVLAVASQRN